MNQNEPVSKGHPKGLYILFSTEMWERFNYYGMRAVLVLFCIKALKFEESFADGMYGSYTSLVYLTPLIGGYLADRYWGNSRSIITGGLVMALGEFILFFCGSVYVSAPGLSQILFFTGLGLMISGNGFFKPNISSLVGQLYPDGDKRKDAAYTIFYMGINIGGAFGPIVCGLVGDTGNPADFRWAFLAGGIGMLLSVLVQKLFQQQYVISPEGKPLGVTPKDSPGITTKGLVIIGGTILFTAGMIGLLYLDMIALKGLLSYLLVASVLFIAFVIFRDKTLTHVEKQRVAVIFILAFFVVFFWSAFEQAGSTLTIFADRQTDRSVSIHIPKWIIYLISLGGVYGLYLVLQQTRQKLLPSDDRLKNTIYILLFLALGGLLYGNYSLITNGQPDISPKEVPASLFQSLNSIFVVTFAPIFAWFWLKLGSKEPSSPTKMAIGLLFLALGYLWIAFGVKGIIPGMKVSMIWLTVMYLLHTFGELSLSPIGLSLVNKLAPYKFASLLMAVWFLANAGANKLVGIIGALYPTGGRTTFFMGYRMQDTHDFFMLFVFMAGAASIILFIITKWLQGMMHQHITINEPVIGEK
jgi:POT family proton-dependent oligopeptide transporter